MIGFFCWTAVGAFVIGILSEIIKDFFLPEIKISKTEKYFYLTPEQNIRIDKANRSRSFCLSLLEGVALVSLVLLLYWLYL